MRRDFLIWVGFPALLPVLHAAELSLPSQVAGPGSSVSISIAFDPGTSPVSGLQFDLQYDNAIMSIVATPGDSIGAADKNIYLSDLFPNQRRFLVAGLNQNAMPGGSLLNLFLNLNSNAPAGVYSLVISNLTGTDPRGSASPLTGANGALTVEGSLGSPIQVSGVLNAGSLVSGPVAPGEIIVLVGSGIGPAIDSVPISSGSSTVLAGISVLIGGNAAPLLYAGPNEINAVVPYEVGGQDSVQLSVMNSGQLTAGLPLAVADAAPGIFTLSGNGVGQGAILNQDSTVNSPSNPAARGSVVVLYATGAGAMNPAQADGQVTGNNPPLTSLPVSVQIGGAAAQVQYAGAAPGLIAGVLQVNCVVPQNIVPGESVPVDLTVGSTSSPSGVTIAIQ